MSWSFIKGRWRFLESWFYASSRCIPLCCTGAGFSNQPPAAEELLSVARYSIKALQASTLQTSPWPAPLPECGCVAVIVAGCHSLAGWVMLPRVYGEACLPKRLERVQLLRNGSTKVPWGCSRTLRTFRWAKLQLSSSECHLFCISLQYRALQHKLKDQNEVRLFAKSI